MDQPLSSPIYVTGRRRRRGRPPALEPTARLRLRVPVPLYEALALVAARRAMPVAAVAKEILGRSIYEPPKNTG
jgi:hypothetical protein